MHKETIAENLKVTFDENQQKKLSLILDEIDTNVDELVEISPEAPVEETVNDEGKTIFNIDYDYKLTDEDLARCAEQMAALDVRIEELDTSLKELQIKKKEYTEEKDIAEMDRLEISHKVTDGTDKRMAACITEDDYKTNMRNYICNGEIIKTVELFRTKEQGSTIFSPENETIKDEYKIAKHQTYFDIFNENDEALIYLTITPGRLTEIKDLIIGETWFEDIIKKYENSNNGYIGDTNEVLQEYYQKCKELLKESGIVA